MYNQSKLFVLYFFFLLIAFTPGVISPSFVPQYLNSPSSAVRLPHEQEALVGHLADKYSQPKALVSRIVQAAYAEGKRIGLSPLTLLAIIEKESGFRPSIVNYYGAVGLMQVVPRFHRNKLASQNVVAELQKPEVNIHVGATILSEYLVSKGGNIDKALVKYSGNANKYSEKVAVFQQKLSVVQYKSYCSVKVKACYA